jgi:RNA polymerase sigma factor (sigma-70 family)
MGLRKNISATAPLVVNESCSSYFKQQISHYKRLSDEEVRTLCARMRNDGPGAIEARNEMLCANLPLVISTAGKYSHLCNGVGITFDDLRSEGILGLVKAVNNFDPGHGCAFGPYASRIIGQSITRFLTDKSEAVRQPRPKQGKKWKPSFDDVASPDDLRDDLRDELYNELCDELTDSRSDVPDDGHAAPESGEGDGQPRYVQTTRRPRSKARYVSTDEVENYAADYCGDLYHDKHEIAQFVQAVVDKMHDARARAIFCRRFGLGCEPATNVAIARDLGLSPDTVSRSVNHTLHALRKALGNAA